MNVTDFGGTIAFIRTVYAKWQTAAPPIPMRSLPRAWRRRRDVLDLSRATDGRKSDRLHGRPFRWCAVYPSGIS